MRVLIIGDSPHIKTGFGRVNLIAAKRFQQEGWDVSAISGLSTKVVDDDQGIQMYYPDDPADLLGVGKIEPAVSDFKPDVIYATADIGSVTFMMQGLPDMPMMSYIPIEGAPIVHEMWQKILRHRDWISVSKYGADLVRQQFGTQVDYVHHGVDHSVFNVTGNREATRKAFRWQDKFVIACVATNVRRKQLPRLIEAVGILKHQFKQKNIVLYIHTVPFQHHFLEGWNLLDLVDMFDVRDQVAFHPHMSERNSFIPEITNDPNFPGLVEILNACDLSVNVSQVEGASLTNIEAMACGLPVLTTKYAAGWEMVEGAGRGIPVHDWEVHKSGTMYANVHPPVVAQEILRLIRSPKDLQRMSAASLRRAQDFQWSGFEDKLIPAMEQAIVAYQKRNPESEETDPGSEDEDGAQRAVGSQGEDTPAQDDSGTPGQGQDPISEGAQDGTLAPQDIPQEATIVED